MTHIPAVTDKVLFKHTNQGKSFKNFSSNSIVFPRKSEKNFLKFTRSRQTSAQETKAIPNHTHLL